MESKNYKIIENLNSGAALSRQKKINEFNFPFTLNTTTGCLFQCSYCYLRFVRMFNIHAEFGKELKVKKTLAQDLRKDLAKFRGLDQQYKRVQMNPATEGYLPQLYNWYRERFAEDSSLQQFYPVNRKCLEAFKEEKEKFGSTWMIHIVTKSMNILEDIDILKEMKDQIQVEVTITNSSDENKHIFEPLAPSTRKRFELIETLSNAGIFVRVMAMPILGPYSDKEAIWTEAQKRGARAMKSKDLNYVTVESLVEESKTGIAAKRVKGRCEDPRKELLILSGEPYQRNGIVPKHDRTTLKYVKGMRPVYQPEVISESPYMNYGYETISSLNWGDCK